MRPTVVFPEPAGPSIAMITLESRRGLQAGYLVRPEWADVTLGKVTELKPIDAHPLQIEHGIAKRLPQPAHFPFAALTQHHGQPRVAIRAVEQLDLCRLESLPSHDHPLREPPHCRFTGLAPDYDPVFLLDMVAGVHQAAGQFAVVRHPHQPSTVEIDPAHREGRASSRWAGSISTVVGWCC